MKKSMIIAIAALVLGAGIFGVKALADSVRSGSCCFPGSACCTPGAACCR